MKKLTADRMHGALVSAIVLGLSASAAAASDSKAVEWLLDEEIAAGCNGGEGRFDSASVIERDLSGDGRADLIISHDGLRCGAGERSALCGIRSCLVLLYVREGRLLKKRKEVLSIGVSVGYGRRPPIELVSDRGGRYTLRWNGNGFE